MTRSGAWLPGARTARLVCSGAIALLCTSCQLLFFNPAGERTGPPTTKTLRSEQATTPSVTQVAIAASTPAASGLRVRFEGSDLCELKETVATLRAAYPVNARGQPINVAPWLGLDLAASGGLVVAGAVVQDTGSRGALIGTGAALGAGSLLLFALRRSSAGTSSIEERSTFTPCRPSRPFADREVSLVPSPGAPALMLRSGSDGSVEVPASLLGGLLLLQPSGARPWHLSFTALNAHATWEPTDATLQELGPAWTCAAASDWRTRTTAPLDLPRLTDVAARLAAAETTCPTPVREGFTAWCEQLRSTRAPVNEEAWLTVERASARCGDPTRCEALGDFLAQGLPEKDLLLAARLIKRLRTGCPDAVVAPIEAPLTRLAGRKAADVRTFADTEELLRQLLDAAEVLPGEARDRLLSTILDTDGLTRGAISRAPSWEEARRRVESIASTAPRLPERARRSFAQKVVKGILQSLLHLAVEEGQDRTHRPRASEREAARRTLAAAERVLGKKDPLVSELDKQRSVFEARF